MNKILALREKRANLWNETKAFLDSHRGEDGMISAEDNATYEKMEADVVALGKEIERLERQAVIDRELDQPTASPLVSRPTVPTDRKQGRASDEYRNAFWGMIRSRTAAPSVMNALQIGTDSEGGYLVPDEYERTLVQAGRHHLLSKQGQGEEVRIQGSLRHFSFCAHSAFSRGGTQKRQSDFSKGIQVFRGMVHTNR